MELLCQDKWGRTMLLGRGGEEEGYVADRLTLNLTFDTAVRGETWRGSNVKPPELPVIPTSSFNRSGADSPYKGNKTKNARSDLES